MLILKYSHEQYQAFLQEFLTKLYIDTNQYITLIQQFKYIQKLWIADLSGIVPFLKPIYSSSSQGAPPKDPVAMFRSLILMTLSGETSISNWVKTLKSNPFFAVLSGFIPAFMGNSNIDSVDADPIPGIGTFYDFMDRLIVKDKIPNKSKQCRKKKKPRKKQKKNQKMSAPTETLTEKLFNRIIKYNDSYH